MTKGPTGAQLQELVTSVKMPRRAHKNTFYRLSAFIVIFCLILGVVFARFDTASDLRATDSSLRDAKSALDYYQGIAANIDGNIFIQVDTGMKKEFLPVSKEKFKEWTAAEIATERMSINDINALIQLSTYRKKTMRVVISGCVNALTHRIHMIEEKQ